MKKKQAALLSFTMVSLFFSGCSAANTVTTSNKEITCAHVVKEYEDAGYEVFHNEPTTEDYDWICYVRATEPASEDYIYFHFFETHEKAKEYADDRQYNALVFLFSLIYGDPTWQTTKVYNNIELEYDESVLYTPFQQLTKKKLEPLDPLH